MSIKEENGTYYLVINSTNTNSAGTMTITLDAKEHDGYKTSVGKNNLYKTN